MGLVLLTWLAGVRLPAQQFLVVENHGKPTIVRGVHRGYPCVMEDGKLVPVMINRSVLVSAPEYLPAFITVSGIRVSSSHLNMMGAGLEGEINHEFHFRADFASPYTLENVFLVLELDTQKMGKVIFYYEVESLRPGHRSQVDLTVRLSSPVGEGKYKLHLFTDGMEVFHSQQPSLFRESMLDAMVAKRIAGVKEAKPKPLVGPSPEYPEELKKSGIRGEVLVRLRVTAKGVVVGPVVDKTTRPEFAENALTAVRMWRFLPLIKDGRPVETEVTLPFIFDPPEPDKG